MVRTLIKTDRGFTLIELLVVIAIIGMLSAVILASLTSARSKARDARRFSDLRAIATAMELYAQDNNGRYPVLAADSRYLPPSVVTPPVSTTNTWADVRAVLVPKYLPVLPNDPTLGKRDGLMCSTCGEYYLNSNGTKFSLSTYLANDNPNKTGANAYGPYFMVTGNCRPFDFWSCN